MAEAWTGFSSRGKSDLEVMEGNATGVDPGEKGDEKARRSRKGLREGRS